MFGIKGITTSQTFRGNDADSDRNAPGRNDSPSARTARDRSRRKAAHVGAADRAAGAVVAAVVQMSGCAGKRRRDGACRAGERLTAGK